MPLPVHFAKTVIYRKGAPGRKVAHIGWKPVILQSKIHPYRCGGSDHKGKYISASTCVFVFLLFKLTKNHNADSTVYKRNNYTCEHIFSLLMSYLYILSYTDI